MKFDVEVHYQTESGAGSKRYRGIEADSDDLAITEAHRRLRQNNSVMKIHGGEVSISKPAAPSAATDSVADTFKAEFAALKHDHADAIAALAEKTRGADLDDFHWEMIDELKGYLGARAANGVSDDAGEQEEAILEMEAFVAAEVSTGGAEDTIAVAFYLKGTSDGARAVEKAAGLRPSHVSP